MASVWGFVALIVVGIIAFSFFGTEIGKLYDDFQASIQEAEEDKKDTGTADPDKVGNTVGERCNLRVTFVGAIDAINLYGVNPFDEGLYLYLGNHPLPELLGAFPDFDDSIVKYQWFCQSVSPLSIIEYNLQKNSFQTLSVFDRTSGEEIRIKFEAFSKETGLNMIDKRNVIVFQNEQKLSFDEDYPVALNVEIFVEDVVNDDYDLEFWDEKDNVGVNGAPKTKGTRYHYDLCEAGKTSC